MYNDLKLPNKVTIHEIGPRDGLQNIEKYIPAESKLRFIDMLYDAGCKIIEMTSFVSPKAIPQMKDASVVFEKITHYNDISKRALVPNVRGAELAIKAGVKHLVTVLSVSNQHNRDNLNKSTMDSIEEINNISSLCRQNNCKFTANIATAFGWDKSGDIALDSLLYVCDKMLAAGTIGITLCDTKGIANPATIYGYCVEVLKRYPQLEIAIHLHQRDGMEYANILSALQCGITTFESSCAGLGGCPFAKGAPGNIATEKLVTMLHEMGIDTGIHLDKMQEAATLIRSII
jgi:hydroxymethylglutaryl-CoA lyase